MAIEARVEVLVVEDHPLYGEGLVHWLAQRVPHLHCRVMPDAPQALTHLRRHGGADLVLADHHLPGSMDGLRLLERVSELHPTAARVLISGVNDARLQAEARRIGCLGFLPKALEPDVWLGALRAILAGNRWFPSQRQMVGGLTKRQLAIMERVAAGHTNKLIARELGITERTIKYHLTAVFERVQARGRTEAVARAASLGWIGLPGR